jgi:FixJ family two-component response regulator
MIETKVIVVDDEENLRSLVKNLLESEDIMVRYR